MIDSDMKKITNFIRFHFEEDFDIKEILTYEYTYLQFENCIFYKKADFSNFIFNGKIVLGVRYEFSKTNRIKRRF